MANVSEKFGLRPYRKLDGTPLVGAQNRYTIASGYSDAIFQGEMVEPLGTGNIQRHGPNTSDAVVGVFNGCFYTDPTTVGTILQLGCNSLPFLPSPDLARHPALL